MEKNLLLFFPYRFFPEKDSDLEGKELVEAVVSGLNVDFSAALQYRVQVAPGYETFFTTVCESDFLLMEFRNDRLALVDTVPLSACPTYIHLKEYTEFWDLLEE